METGTEDVGILFYIFTYCTVLFSIFEIYFQKCDLSFPSVDVGDTN